MPVAKGIIPFELSPPGNDEHERAGPASSMMKAYGLGFALRISDWTLQWFRGWMNLYVRIGVYRSSKWCHHFVRNSVYEVSMAPPWNKNKGPSVLKAPAFTAAFRVDEKKCFLKKKSFLVSLWDLFGMVICDPFKGWKGDLQRLRINQRSRLWITTCEGRFLLNRECSWVIFLTKIWVWQDQRSQKHCKKCPMLIEAWNLSGPRWTKTYAFGKLDQI